MRALDRKLVRDLLRLWPQALAIALVVASGYATFILGVGARRSLDATRAAYYERYAFADVFATLKRAPKAVGQRILAIPGIATAETRIVKGCLIDVVGVEAPASALAISLPPNLASRLNRLYLRSGRLPEADHLGEVVVNESFAKANRLEIGSQFDANMNGRQRRLTITGVALSPEYIYAIGPGDLVPNDRRFAILWMPEKALAAIYDLEGAFNAVAVKLLAGTNGEEIVDALDILLERYGGLGAYTRENQTSHAFLDNELEQLAAMSRILPPIFLAVSAFLINMTLTRLIVLEREQIGLLKAFGYSRAAVAIHYLKFVVIIAFIGALLGAAAGNWLGRGLTQLYGNFFHFPFLIFQRDPDIYVLAFVISAGAAVLGGLRASLQAFALPPAVAMQPPAPQRFHHLPGEKLGLFKAASQLTVMALRGMARTPVRVLTTLTGLSLATSLLITAMFTLDSLDHMIDISFFRTARQHATINLADAKDVRVVQSVARLPGVMRAEPFRAIAVKLRNGNLERRTAIYGKPIGQDLNLVVDKDFKRVEPPRQGLLINERLASVLDLHRGDEVEVEIMEGRRGIKRAVVSDVISSFFGLATYMEMSALNALLNEGHLVSGVHVALDDSRLDDFYRAVKRTPQAGSLMLQRVSLAKFRETIGENINIMTMVYIALAVIIAVGVVYNSARILLSERARELASLRVLGFTRTEVSRVLLTELAILMLLAQPVGWVLGHMFAWIVVTGLSSDLFTIPFLIETRTYARASLVVLAAAVLSTLLVRRRIDRLDLVSVLKARE